MLISNQGAGFFFLGDGNALKRTVVMVAHPCESTKTPELYTLSE